MLPSPEGSNYSIPPLVQTEQVLSDDSQTNSEFIQKLQKFAKTQFNMDTSSSQMTSQMEVSKQSNEINEPNESINPNPWQQVVHDIKRKRFANNNTNLTPTSNRFDTLINEDNNNQETNSNIIKTVVTPPVFLYGVRDFKLMISSLNTVFTSGQYTTKILPDQIVKIKMDSADNYRKFIHYLQERNTVYHTYQIKSERSYRVVLKYMHHSTDINEIKTAIEKAGIHKVRNILNVLQPKTKHPLNMFYVDLEPNVNNASIFKINRLLNQVIHFETPFKNSNIIQCARCQLHGHSKRYCNRPPNFQERV